ncbi:MAG TPA: hypothetical protein VF898_02745 [Chloroflexota bacterium]
MTQIRYNQGSPSGLIDSVGCDVPARDLDVPHFHIEADPPDHGERKAVDRQDEQGNDSPTHLELVNSPKRRTVMLVDNSERRL